MKKKDEAQRFQEVVERAPKELADRMAAALAQLDRNMPPAHSGEVLSTRMTW